MRKIACSCIYVYQYLISACFAPCCRFYPSCSQYAVDSITQFGVLKGIWLAIGRILRCHPGSKGGYDPVLSKKEKI